jgi:hypothetical protein
LNSLHRNNYLAPDYEGDALAPNWRKKFAQSLEFIFSNESLQTFFA